MQQSPAVRTHPAAAAGHHRVHGQRPHAGRTPSVRPTPRMAGPAEQQSTAGNRGGAGQQRRRRRRRRRDVVGGVFRLVVQPAVVVAPAPDAAVQVQLMRQRVRLQARAAEPRTHAHRRKAVRVFGV